MSVFLTQTASDNFHYADVSPLPSPPWTSVFQGLQVVSDLCEASSASTQIEVYSGTTLVADQYASATIANSVNGSILFLDVREQYHNEYNYCYELILTNGGAGSSYVSVFAYNGGPSSILSLTGLTVNIGDVWTLAVIGSTVYVLQNGTVLGSVSDSTWASGQYSALGMQDASAVTDIQVSLFAIGGAATTGSISGNAGIAGATVSYTGTASGSVTANGSGNYSITGLFAGSYTITPSLSGWGFSPTSQNVTLTSSNATGINFTATPTATAGPTATLNSDSTYRPRPVQLFASLPNGEIAGVSVDSNGNLSVGSSGNINTIDILGNLSEAVVCVIAGPTSGSTVPGAQGGLVFAAVDTFGNLIASVSAIAGSPNTTVDVLVEQGVVAVQCFGRQASTGELIGCCANTQGGLGTTLNPILNVPAGGPAGIDTLYPDEGQWPIPIILCGRVVAGYSNSGKIVPVSLTASGGLAISGAPGASTTPPTISFNNSVATPIQCYARTSAGNNNVLTSVPLNSLGQLSFN